MPTPNFLQMNQPAIGKLIHALRIEAGLTQEQFATHLGVVYSTVNRWENGHAQPSPLAMKLIEQKLLDMGKQGQQLLARYSTQ